MAHTIKSPLKLEAWETQPETRTELAQASQQFFDNLGRHASSNAPSYDVPYHKAEGDMKNQVLMVTPIKREWEGADISHRSPLFSTPLYDEDRKQSCTEQFEFTDRIDKLIKKSDNVYTPPLKTRYDLNHTLASAKMESDATNRSFHNHVEKQNKLMNSSFELRNREFDFNIKPRLSCSAPPILGIKKSEQSIDGNGAQALVEIPAPHHSLIEIRNRQYMLEQKRQRIKVLWFESLTGDITPEQRREWKKIYTPPSIPTAGKIPPLKLDFEGFETTQSDPSSSLDDDLNREINESVNAQPLTGGHLLRPDRHQHYGR